MLAIEELRNYLHPHVQYLRRFLHYSSFGEDHKDMLVQFERESLQEILDILIREPLADYFWYTYKENGGQLCYSLPGDVVVPSGALRVDKEKIKPFLRDIKIQSLLDK
jgi:hypothetical protein